MLSAGVAAADKCGRGLSPQPLRAHTLAIFSRWWVVSTLGPAIVSFGSKQTRFSTSTPRLADTRATGARATPPQSV